MIRYGSVCSGIEAATVAWEPLGWQAQFFSEIDAAPRAVLSHHYPQVPLHGDFTTIEEGQYGAIDLLVGGTPCQSFSVAGLRGGLADGRGNLSLEYLRLAKRLRPRWVAWENVPGVLSSNGGRDFGAILGGLVELGYGFAYRVLDAQYVRIDGFGRAVPQRRRRVFVVGYLGDWRRAAAVLLERSSLRGDPAPRRSPGQIAAASLTGSLGRRRGLPDGGDTDGHLIAEETCGTLGGTSPGGGWRLGADEAAAGQLIAALTAGTLAPGAHPGGFNGQDAYADHLVAYGSGNTRGPIDVATTLTSHGGSNGRLDFESETFIAFAQNSRDEVRLFGGDGQTVGALAAEPGMKQTTYVAFNSRQDPDVTWDRSGSLNSSLPQAEAIARIGHNSRQSWAVRRLTPLECERLQGIPDGYTDVPFRNGRMSDGPRYKMLGNSMASNVMRWIGTRIQMVEGL